VPTGNERCANASSPRSIVATTERSPLSSGYSPSANCAPAWRTMLSWPVGSAARKSKS
jgi:hypothetical protein